MQQVFKSKVCETKSLAPASSRMTETDTIPRTQTTQSLNLIARNWSYHYKNTHKTVRLLMHMCIPSIYDTATLGLRHYFFFQLANFRYYTVFAYWYSTNEGICNAPMCTNHLNEP